MTETLRKIKRQNRLLGDYSKILQNVQDSKFNYKRYDPVDELEERTEIFKGAPEFCRSGDRSHHREIHW